MESLFCCGFHRTNRNSRNYWMLVVIVCIAVLCGYATVYIVQALVPSALRYVTGPQLRKQREDSRAVEGSHWHAWHGQISVMLCHNVDTLAGFIGNVWVASLVRREFWRSPRLDCLPTPRYPSPQTPAHWWLVKSLKNTT